MTLGASFMIGLLWPSSIQPIIEAQARLETGNFRSDSYKTGRNLFGMKMATQRLTTATGVYLGHASYLHDILSVVDRFIWERKGFPIDPEQYLQYLKLRGYAEDPSYLQKIRKIANL